MYQLQDASGTFLPTAYFFALIVLASFFLLNIFLAVIGESWDNIEAERAEKEEEAEVEAEVKRLSHVSDPVDSLAPAAAAQMAMQLIASENDDLQFLEFFKNVFQMDRKWCILTC